VKKIIKKVNKPKKVAAKVVKGSKVTFKKEKPTHKVHKPVTVHKKSPKKIETGSKKGKAPIIKRTKSIADAL